MRKTALIFDFDYTLADSSKGAVKCINHALQSMGEAPRSYDDCCATIGLSLPETYKTLTGKANPEEIAMFYRLFVEKADEIMASSTTLYDGVTDMVRRLAANGFVLGIVSTKFRYRIECILDRYNLSDHFAAIIGGEDVQKNKPDPEGLYQFFSKVPVKHEYAVLAGDSLIDAETARNGGIDFVAVLTGTTPAERFIDYSPKVLLESVVEIEEYVRQ